MIAAAGIIPRLGPFPVPQVIGLHRVTTAVLDRHGIHLFAGGKWGKEALSGLYCPVTTRAHELTWYGNFARWALVLIGAKL